jgi:ABC-type polysaccharide/polyol phosphate export permease
MIWSKWIRQFHRWTSIVFTAVVLVIFTILGLGSEPAAWVYFLPLFPLALLVPTGLYMFVQPDAAGRRGARRQS